MQSCCLAQALCLVSAVWVSLWVLHCWYETNPIPLALLPDSQNPVALTIWLWAAKVYFFFNWNLFFPGCSKLQLHALLTKLISCSLHSSWIQCCNLFFYFPLLSGLSPSPALWCWMLCGGRISFALYLYSDFAILSSTLKNVYCQWLFIIRKKWAQYFSSFLVELGKLACGEIQTYEQWESCRHWNWNVMHYQIYFAW